MTLNMDPRSTSAMASHIHVLTAIVLHTSGPILEFGSGPYSTPLLHELALISQRELLTVDNCEEWLSHFAYLQNEWHTLKFVEDWTKFEESLQLCYWDVVFIDHAPTLRRKTDIELLRDRANYIVVHDSDAFGYQCDEVFRTFEYRFDNKRKPWTSVFSNKYELDFLERGI